MRRLDRYIIRIFLRTFILSLTLLLALVIVFDFAEKLDEFFGSHEDTPSFRELILDYYVNFVPYFAGLYAPLFVFIAVVFFNSRLAMRSELVAIFGAGISYFRFLRPYVLTASAITLALLYLAHFAIPRSNGRRVLFEKKYLSGGQQDTRNIYRQVAPGVFVYMDWFSPPNNFGHKFSLEKFSANGLQEKWMAVNVTYDSLTGRWSLHDYLHRIFTDSGQIVVSGPKLDTIFPFKPDYFELKNKDVETMESPKLRDFIRQEKASGTPAVVYYEIELQKRTSVPLSTIVFTLLAVPLSSRRVRGGTGLHVGLGLAVAFFYIFLDRIFITYAYNGILVSFWAVWLPNIFFAAGTICLNVFFSNRL
ncbi:MAG: LptF/LptG family permease [Flavobacteriales bacterium]|nr:LptF/LptG family permease [Flavobacteriales bacterium]MCX7767697.1 LptF/LptG family permease [Flavobacteriales bacterium]MDW8409409.1 LptF/LptG family permease [Flavobacteriales bacterium]